MAKVANSGFGPRLHASTGEFRVAVAVQQGVRLFLAPQDGVHVAQREPAHKQMRLLLRVVSGTLRRARAPPRRGSADLAVLLHRGWHSLCQLWGGLATTSAS